MIYLDGIITKAIRALEKEDMYGEELVFTEKEKVLQKLCVQVQMLLIDEIQERRQRHYERQPDFTSCVALEQAFSEVKDELLKL